MKIAFLTLGLAALLPALTSAQAADVDVGVSIGISQPGVYGRIDIGRFPQPQVIVAQPVYVQRPVHAVRQPEPVYMWVPPGHRNNWKEHCGAYGACGVPVYFVRHDWYDQKVRHGGRGLDHGRDPRGHGDRHNRDDGRKGQGHGKGRD